MYVIVESGLGVGREPWQQLLDDVLILDFLMALELAKLLVEVPQKCTQLEGVRKVCAMQLEGARGGG